jgi:MFS family permease
MKPRSLLSTPGVAGPFLASLLARLPTTSMGLLFVLYVEDLTGRFALAGLAAGAYTVGMGVSAPVIGRLVDRRGQTAVLGWGSVLCALILLAITALPASSPTAIIIVLALATGVTMPPISSAIRALWMTMFTEPDARHTAFAVDSAVLESLYVLAPVLLAGGIGALSLRAALLASAFAAGVGGLLYVLQPAVRAWRPVEARSTGLAGPLVAPAVRTLLCIVLGLGCVFGAVEVGVAAVADGAGHSGAAGPLLGAWGLGSTIGAIVIARRPAPPDPARALIVRLLALAAVDALLLLTTDPLLLAPLLVIAGFGVAPALNAGFVLMGDAAPAGTTTEAFTWSTCGIAAGSAIGTTISGTLADHGPSGPFVVAAAAGLLALLVGGVRQPVLARVRPAA